MISWILLAFVSGALVLGAALCFDVSARAIALPRRFVWSAAMLAIVVIPLVAPLIPIRAIPSPVASAVAQRLPAITVFSGPSTATVPSGAQGFASGWFAVSAVLLVRHARARHRLARLRRRWERTLIDGTSVEVSAATGPAVVGLRDAVIVVPEWFASLPDEERRVILVHEREHLAANDHLLLAAARVLTMLVPWHPGLWVARRQLHVAVEQDCDARVLACGVSAAAYADILVNIAHRASARVPVLAPALLEPTSSLSRRITTMFAPRTRFPRVVFATSSAAGVCLLALGCVTREPLGAKPVHARDPLIVTAIQSPSSAGGDSVFLEYQVQQPVRPVAGTRPPFYPDSLRAAGVEGEVLAEFIVDKDGRANMSSWKVLKATNEQFANAVRDAVPSFVYTPAQKDGRIVRQLVQQPFAFFIAKPQ